MIVLHDYFLFPFRLMHSFFFRKMQMPSAVYWADSLKMSRKKYLPLIVQHFFKIYIELIQPTHAIIIKAWVMPVERAVI